MVLLLRIPPLNQEDCLESLSIRILIKENLLVTMSRTKLPVIQTVMEKINATTHEFSSPFYLLWLICKYNKEAISDYILNLSAMCNNKLIDEHPDTGFVVNDLQIPYWPQLLKLAIDCHPLSEF